MKRILSLLLLLLLPLGVLAEEQSMIPLSITL